MYSGRQHTPAYCEGNPVSSFYLRPSSKHTSVRGLDGAAAKNTYTRMANVVWPRIVTYPLAAAGLALGAVVCCHAAAGDALPGGAAGQAAPAAAGSVPAVPRRLKLSGTPFERGKAHGTALRDEVQAVLLVWRRELHAKFSSANTVLTDDDTVAEWCDGFVTGGFLATTEFAAEATMRKWAPGLLEELKGLAEGAGVSYEELLALQLRDECDRVSSRGRFARRGERTTSLAVAGVRKAAAPALLGQASELEAFRSTHQVVLEVAGGAKGQAGSMFFAHAGLVAPMCGINEHGLAVTADALPQLAPAAAGVCAGFVTTQGTPTTTRYIQ